MASTLARTKKWMAPGGYKGPAGLTLPSSSHGQRSSEYFPLYRAFGSQCGTLTHSMTREDCEARFLISSVHFSLSSRFRETSPSLLTSHPLCVLLKGTGRGVFQGFSG